MSLVKRSCARCGKDFEARSARRRTCSDKCRKALSRAAQLAPVTDAPDAPNRDEAPGDRDATPGDGPGPLWRITYEQLSAVDRLDTPLGALALQHAAVLDDPRRGDTGSSRAALSKEYRAALAEAMQDAETERDELDDILESATVKLLPGGAR